MTEPGEDATGSGGPKEPGHVLALDGIRAVAMLVVLLFHLRIPGFRAGFSWHRPVALWLRIPTLGAPDSLARPRRAGLVGGDIVKRRRVATLAAVPITLLGEAGISLAMTTVPPIEVGGAGGDDRR